MVVVVVGGDDGRSNANTSIPTNSTVGPIKYGNNDTDNKPKTHPHRRKWLL